MKKTVIALTLILSSAMASAQQAKDPAPIKDPVTTVVRAILERQRNNLVAAVDEMPADKFGFKPTPDQMTFGHLVLHMFESNISLCNKVSHMPLPPIGKPPGEEKVKLLAYLNKSFDYCQSALSQVDDSMLGQTIEGYGGKPQPVAWGLIALTNDWADHYSAAAQYLRLNGLLPPTAEPKK
jgi:hypothetical protein